MEYQEFLRAKKPIVKAIGVEINDAEINQVLFPFQRDLVKWSVRKGRAAIFADTGLGKTLMQVEWARLIGERTLILAPLSVARQTVRQAKALLDIDVHYTRSSADLSDGINITNYEMVEHFNARDFGAVVLDESSILKALDGKTRKLLTRKFKQTPYKLCCTATPAPNDITELGRHAEFLNVMSNAEMLAAFFINDMKQKDGTYRLKRHAVEPFYRWLSSWAIAITKPSDLGYDDNGYLLPPLNILPTYVKTDFVPDGQLFFIALEGIQQRSEVRRETHQERCEVAALMVKDSAEQWIVWCGLNKEADLMTSLIPGAVNVEGNQKPEDKAAAFEAFQDGSIRVLVTKPRIAGFGMNFQNAHNMIFVGLDDSFEAYYQCIRRCYRFGQEKEVNAHIVLADVQQAIFENVSNKEHESRNMTQELISRVKGYEMEELGKTQAKEWTYRTAEASSEDWQMMLGDSCERMAELDDDSLALSVFSPPFVSLYTYTPTERDMGNSKNEDEFFAQFRFIIDELLRATMPGRNCAVHVQQVAALKSTDGYIGLKDFRGDVIRAFIEAGWIFHGEITVDKNPQIQAIRTKAKGLLFVQKDKDSTASRPAMADYVLIFKKPGDNPIPVQPDVTNEEWIQWAHPVWYDISETDVLNVAQARDDRDERHICPLQLGLIARLIRLYSNPDEVVFDPFAGIGSTGYEAVRYGRKFIGIELKPEYFDVAVRNLDSAERDAGQVDLFQWAAMQTEEANAAK